MIGTWIVSFMRPDYPVRYFLYDRHSGKTVALGVLERRSWPR